MESVSQMVSGIVVFYKIATTCLLILVGYIVRRMKLLPENSVSVVSAYLLYVGLPTYMIYYTPASITLETLGTYWYYPVIGAALLFVCDMFGWLTSRLWAGPGEGPTFRLLVALPNWVFMAMAVVEPIFREEGVRVVLLYNLGITLYVWTAGVASFRDGETFLRMLRNVLLNPQTVALAIGFFLALAAPFLVGMEKMGSDELQALPLYISVFSPQCTSWA